MKLFKNMQKHSKSFNQRHPVIHKVLKGACITETALLGLIILGIGIGCLTTGSASPKITTHVGNQRVSSELDPSNKLLDNLSTHPMVHHMLEEQVDPKTKMSPVMKHVHPKAIVMFQGKPHMFNNANDAKHYMSRQIAINQRNTENRNYTLEMVKLGNIEDETNPDMHPRGNMKRYEQAVNAQNRLIKQNNKLNHESIFKTKRKHVHTMHEDKRFNKHIDPSAKNKNAKTYQD